MLKWFSREPKPPPYLAMAEYWVYLNEPTPPTQDQIMARMIQASPFRKGKAPVGQREGLLWSDIRFHMALVAREKNAHIFRPDLFESHVEPTPELLSALSAAKAMLKLRYVSDQPLPDTRHLQFLAHALESVAHLSGAQVVFDLVGERLFSPEWLVQRLSEDNDGSRRDLHLRVLWRTCERGGVAETRGLAKIGLPELCTPETMEDHRVVAIQVLEAAADEIWDAGQMPAKIAVDRYGDRFHVLIERRRKGPYSAKILREAGCAPSE